MGTAEFHVCVCVYVCVSVCLCREVSNANLTREIIMSSSSLNLGGVTRGIPSFIPQEEGVGGQMA